MRGGIYEAMTMLYKKAEGRMNASDLSGLTDLTELAVAEARNLSAVCDGLACLVAEDASNSTGAGNFRTGNEVFSLLCSLSHGFTVIAGMVEIGAAARLRMNNLEVGDDAEGRAT